MNHPIPVRPRWATPVAAVAFAFGALTVFSGANVLFGSAAAGDVVPFVLRFNTLAGFAYMLAAVGLYRARRWSAQLSAIIAIATVTVFAAFGWQVATGSAFEPRTVGAMVLRSGFWVVLAVVACRTLGCGRNGSGTSRP